MSTGGKKRLVRDGHENGSEGGDIESVSDGVHVKFFSCLRKDEMLCHENT